MSENNNLRKCSRCHATKLEEYFSKNTKGEFYKLCDNCRTKSNQSSKEWKEKNKETVKIMNEKQYDRIRELPLEEQYYICEKCGSRVHRLNEGMSRHQKRWSCVKKLMDGNPGKKEFYQWIVDNEGTILREYKKYINEAKTYLNHKL